MTHHYSLSSLREFFWGKDNLQVAIELSHLSIELSLLLSYFKPVIFLEHVQQFRRVRTFFIS